jgi:hypothetical protein
MVKTERVQKPLNAKAYGHIPHLPGSRMGVGDHHCSPGQARICCERLRDKHDRIIVQEKLDGTCVAVARIAGMVVPLMRAGYPAISSHYEQHRLFAAWVYERVDRFAFLGDGERLCGEWLAQAHGTRYRLFHEPFVPFDIMRGQERATYGEFHQRVGGTFVVPSLIHEGSSLPVDRAMELVGRHGRHGAIDAIEGCVWRVERHGKVDFLAKYVRPDKADGRYLPEISGQEPVWNWRMGQELPVVAC